MNKIRIIGLDLAKQVFQVHAADGAGRCVLRKQLKRHEVLAFFGKLDPCLVAMEACGMAHYWAREIVMLGHEFGFIILAARYLSALWPPRGSVKCLILQRS
jgi:transposase